MRNTILNWLSLALTVVGAVGLVFAARWGFYALLAADLALLPVLVQKREKQQTGMFIVLAVLNAVSIIKWTLEGIG